MKHNYLLFFYLTRSNPFYKYVENENHFQGGILLIATLCRLISLVV
ncbi:hypothetical protein [Arcicella rigui]|uniref:Uncharacterized protein n=1 Tax=Arcicella rigui TaxID=797020 RepID=A0ABU5Q778_9BACT|nr:hypothetical protein [Arcicella rigui]MEA5138696.1 hypothetical protein [Arcicella rigui]